MGKILTRTEHSETEFPVVMMAAPVTDMALPSSAWLKAHGGKYDIDPDSHKRLTLCDNKDMSNRTRCVIQAAANTIDAHGNGDSVGHVENRKREVDSLPLERFVYEYLSFYYEISFRPGCLRRFSFIHCEGYNIRTLCPSHKVDSRIFYRRYN